MVNDYRWFPMLVRAIGLWGIVFAAPSLVLNLVALAVEFSTGGSVGFASSYLAPSALQSFVQCAISLYLLVGAPRFVAYCLRHARGRCPRCDYDLRGITAPGCPECGRPIDRDPPAAAPTHGDPLK